MKIAVSTLLFGDGVLNWQAFFDAIISPDLSLVTLECNLYPGQASLEMTKQDFIAQLKAAKERLEQVLPENIRE